MRTHRRSCKKRRQVWNAEKQTNQKENCREIKPRATKSGDPEEGGRRQGNRASMQAGTRAKWAWGQQQGLPECPVCVCVCLLCVWAAAGHRGAQTTSRKTGTYVSLEGFRKQQGQRGLILEWASAWIWKKRNKGWQVLVTFWGRQSVE